MPYLESFEMKDRSDCLEDVQIFCWEQRSKKEYIMNGILLEVRKYKYITIERTSERVVQMLKSFGVNEKLFCCVFLNHSGVAVGSTA